MPFSRTIRIDRRRRAIRESTLTQPTLGAESSRRSSRKRSEADSGDPAENILRRDPGYSQNVRRACQQRFMQLIPIRRSSLILVISSAWLVWALLLATHYLIHVRGQNWSQLPIASLFHIRNRDSIAHWLGTQLWMITALTAVLIFQVRRHKMDDYRAKYRIWLIYVLAAIACSLDASSSALYRLGWSIDGWARAEIGYSGWSVVFVSFASLVAVLALRLCTELKVAPLSVAFWVFGLFAWGFGAILGTGLIRMNLPQAQLDMLVGGAWLGGILAVWISAWTYLRHIYIQAQRRFVLREGLIRESRSLRMPSFAWSRRAANSMEADSSNGSEEASPSFAKRWLRMPSLRKSVPEGSAETSTKATKTKSTSKQSQRDEILEEGNVASKRTAAASASRAQKDYEVDEDEDHQQVVFNERSATESKTTERKAGWSSWLGRDQSANKSSQVEKANHPVAAKEDRKPNSVAKVKSSSSTNDDVARKPSWWKRTKPANDGTDVTEQKSKPETPARSKKTSVENKDRVSLKHRLAFWKRQTKVALDTVKAVSSAEKSGASSEKRSETPKDKTSSAKPTRGLGNWMSKRTDDDQSETAKPKATAADKSTENVKKSFWARKEKVADTSKAKVEKSDTSGKPKKRLFGILDGLKLKPPVEASGSKQQPTPIAVNNSRPMPTTASSNSSNSNDDDDGDDGDRNLTRAERRRLRREQGQNRKAA
jgi:hypothetical protein